MDYCPFCVSDKTATGYGCGSTPGERSIECIQRENMVLRAEKDHLLQQVYDLEWQLTHYSKVVHVARHYAVLSDMVSELDSNLSLPMRDRDDDLTRAYLVKRSERRARYA
jgi:hypothetical protein